MHDRITHYARFARTLALSSTLLACTESSSDPPATEPTPTPTSGSERAPATSGELGTAAPTQNTEEAKNDAAAPEPGGEDGGGGARISGPLPPPELPLAFTV